MYLCSEPSAGVLPNLEKSRWTLMPSECTPEPSFNESGCIITHCMCNCISNDPLLLRVKVGVYGIAWAGGLGGGHAYERNVRVCQILKIGHEGYPKESRHCCNFLWICFKNLIEFGKENLGNTLFDFVWICFKNICESDHDVLILML